MQDSEVFSYPKRKAILLKEGFLNLDDGGEVFNYEYFEAANSLSWEL